GDDVDCNPAVDCPLFWLAVGPLGGVVPAAEVLVGVEGDGNSVQVHLEGGDGGPSSKWDGRLEVVHPKFGAQTVVLSYSERPEGRWGGNLYYFANFGDKELAAWAATPETKNSQSLVDKVNNAFIRRWFAFRKGNISWDEFLAVVMATRTESWRWPSVIEACGEANGACYPYDIDMDGVVTYTTDTTTNPIPTGVVEMPFAMDLYTPDPAGAPEVLAGRIATEAALQYPGSPAVTLTFGADPSGCQKETGGACLVYIDGLQADVNLGGRYVTTSADDACDTVEAGYALASMPWLVPGFTRATETDPGTGQAYRFECRDTWLPVNPGPGGELTPEMADANLSLAGANPIPDARARRRTFQVVDGALVNQKRMFIIFRETFVSFLPADQQPFSAYGFMLLERQAADLDMEDANGNQVADTFEGSAPFDDRVEPVDVLDVECSPDLVELVLGYGNDQITATNVDDLVLGLIDGVVPSETEPEVLGAASDEEVHYLCVANGLFDGGSGAVSSPWATIPNNNSCGKTNWQSPGGGTTSTSPYAGNGSCDDGGPDADTPICPIGTDKDDCGVRTAADGDFRVPCPAGSDVVFFTVDKGLMSQSDIAAEDCQVDGTCEDTLNEWLLAGSPVIQYQPVWRCTDPDKVYCDENRQDLRSGKEFFVAYEEAAVLTPLYPAIDLAFRYKTQFRSREGQGIGFAPEICIPGSNQIPYCYSPEEIEDQRARIDCLLHVWRYHYTSLPIQSQAKAKLDEYLCTSFSYTEACHSGMAQTLYPHDGFERLYAELLVMMGDESYTQAFASRFDLAQTMGATFEGTLFEPGGLDLSGAAGVEMLLLYRAAQYYQEALDRFYALSPLFWEAMGFAGQGKRNFVTQETVTWYLERLTRA
ncbi:MAG: hypothetical protein FJ098_11200, partial [Deltaproteobacteria bacterium]|nr:hypothetical protein [Deltaproteobacteria bacterium]